MLRKNAGMLHACGTGERALERGREGQRKSDEGERAKESERARARERERERERWCTHARERVT